MMSRLTLFKLVCGLIAVYSAMINVCNAQEDCTTMDLGLQVLMRTGEGPSDSEFPLGLMIDQDNNPVLRAPEVSRRRLLQPEGSKPHISTQPDFTSILTAPDGKMYVVTQFETPYPSVMYIIDIDQDPDTGILTPKQTRPVDLSAYQGAWILCAGSVSPWGTHLAGEEYEPDARLIAEATSLFGEEETSLMMIDEDLANGVKDQLRFWGNYDETLTIEDVRKAFNPYNYGFGIEVEMLAGGEYEATKWYTLGRNSKELVYVMPDNKTVYITDDGTNVSLFKFVMDTPKDLSSGTMYGAKMTQTSDENGGTFDIEWIELGSSTQEELKELLDSGITFADIFETADPSEDSTCPDGFNSINQGYAGQECLKVKEGMETAAAFLEMRRYTAYMGGTTEFSKWEGITYSASRKQLFTAMSELRQGMEDNMSKGEEDASYDVGGPNSVKVAYNSCGCVYAMDVDDEYSATNMYAIICGQPMDVDEFNGCGLDNIANPDNVAMMDEHDVLIIGEDTTSGHQNDVIWSYNLNNGTLDRIVTTPYGAETTSPYWYPDINGFAYITAVAQHPYDETDEDKLDLAVNPDSEGADGYIGYFVMPSSAIKGKDLTFKAIPTATTNAEKSKFYGSPSVTACPKSVSQETFITPAVPAMVAEAEESSSTPVSGGCTAGVLSVSAVVAGLVAMLL